MSDHETVTAPRKKISADERRRRLLDAALRVMKRDGIAAASTRAICAEADMSHGAFHYCFHSKKDLYAALLASDIEIDLGAAWPDISSQASPQENIRTLLLAFWSQIESDPEAQLVLFDLGSFALHNPELQDLPRWEHDVSLNKTTGYIKRLGAEAGLTFLQDERTLAELVLDTLNGVAWSWLAHRDNDQARRSLDQFASIAAALAQKSDKQPTRRSRPTDSIARPTLSQK
ncbi:MULTISPECIES: TetR/AcrR family transcriptional regulator [unclassified Saccharopolyspora]|uniref:TetR/AcrR family transcriptional regulator n=1 Tax=unclassified Saccharopolyspora TaxID=2646250 RepID=UPI001CD59CBD|nr:MULTISPECIES: TetR/AcrR family transcriptional regulator [unclassified Saccharopolyspora]MCA1185966.1 TetR/AcrR family transcriptional regulator [Saccharopolyspora sp. 6T]MCA1192866.1 TetR/AcrR family transcriptional regulator [Saccharopolyspora sp. 6V]MCA1280742.1 TetR/AcrR family transcriptional regulator [Saccharopolyspora sp. 7B]